MFNSLSPLELGSIPFMDHDRILKGFLQGFPQEKKVT